jgi:hypothetical protein
MRTLSRRFFTAALLVCLLLPGIADAQRRKRASTSPQFSYLLVLSYAHYYQLYHETYPQLRDMMHRMSSHVARNAAKKGA